MSAVPIENGTACITRVKYIRLPYIAVIFGGQNVRGSAILRHFVGKFFEVGVCTTGKGRQGRFLRG